MSSFIGNALWKVGSTVLGIPTTVEGALDMMKREPTNADVQQKGCQGLAKLAAGNAENQSRIREAGGIEVVVDALRAHPTSADVQQWGCYALCNLAAGNAENRSRQSGIHDLGS